MSRHTKIGAIALLGGLALPMALSVNSRRQRSAIFIRVDSLPSQTVMLESDNLPSQVHFEKGSRELRVIPISHGVYRIGIQLSDGQTVWCEFFHADTRIRRRIDVTATASSTGFHFRQTANQSKELFDGATTPDNATRSNPFQLDWI